MRAKAAYTDKNQLRELINAARGQRSVDLVVRNARVLDVFRGAFLEPSESRDIAIFRGVIVGTQENYEATHIVDAQGAYLVPGFIDAHVHIESSLMTPVRFQQAVLPCGTTTVIWDPHEIANVKGQAGIEWALRSSEDLALDVFIMVPSCVPSTSTVAALETSGAALYAEQLRVFRDHPRVLGLAEMMNFPGLLHGEADVLDKLVDFSHLRRDGHCPGLSGKDLNAYGVAGIHSCHESTGLSEAREKLSKGIHVLIREGSCAKDADALLPLLNAYTSATVALCSDDRNPYDIAREGHIDHILDKALRAGHAPVDAFRAASYAPAKMYGLEDRGAIAPGYIADFVLVQPRDGKTWTSGLQVQACYKRGVRVQSADLSAAISQSASTGSAAHFPKQRNLQMAEVAPHDFSVTSPDSAANQVLARVVGLIPGQILTGDFQHTLEVKAGEVQADVEQDILKLAVFERHHGTGRKSIAFVQGMGIKNGAIATSINHDAHNVICVGSSDALLSAAVQELQRIDGGIVVVSAAGECEVLPLPIGGLMTDVDPSLVAASLYKLKTLARAIGCPLEEPFLQLSFLALPVIPKLKITDRGLVDVVAFKLVEAVQVV